MLSPIEWENGDHKKGDTWTIQLIKDNSEKSFIQFPYKTIFFHCYMRK